MATAGFLIATNVPIHCYVFAVACSLWDSAVVELSCRTFFYQVEAWPPEAGLRVIENMYPKKYRRSRCFHWHCCLFSRPRLSSAVAVPTRV
jgi:hypothetical protein